MEILKTFAPLFLAVLAVLLTLSFVLAICRGAPFVPTGQEKVFRMLKLAALKKGETLVDLGSGDGRFVLLAAEKGARAIGVELNWVLVLWARLRIWAAGLGDVARIVRSNVLTYDLRGVDVVICYLSPEMNKKLQAKLERELKPGARVLTNTFSFKGWKASARDEKEKLFVYTTGKIRESKRTKS